MSFDPGIKKFINTLEKSDIHQPTSTHINYYPNMIDLPSDIAKIIYGEYVSRRNAMIEDAVNDALARIVESILVGEMKIKKFNSEGVNIEVLSYGSSEQKYRKHYGGGSGDGFPYESHTEEGTHMSGVCVLSINGDVFGIDYRGRIEFNSIFGSDRYEMHFGVHGRTGGIKKTAIVNTIVSALDAIAVKRTEIIIDEYIRGTSIYSDSMSGTNISPEVVEKLLNKNKKINKVKGCGYPKKYRHLLE